MILTQHAPGKRSPQMRTMRTIPSGWSNSPRSSNAPWTKETRSCAILRSQTPNLHRSRIEATLGSGVAGGLWTRTDARAYRFHPLTPNAASGLREMPVAFRPAHEGKHDQPDNDMRSAKFRLRGGSRSGYGQPAGLNRFRRQDTCSVVPPRALWTPGESRRSRLGRITISCHDACRDASCRCLHCRVTSWE